MLTLQGWVLKTCDEKSGGVVMKIHGGGMKR